MRRAFKELTDTHQTVIIHSPPAIVVSAAVATAAAADFTIVVARLGEVRRRDLVRTIEQLRQAGANVLGIIATHATGKGDGYSGDRYGADAYHDQDKRGTRK
ncbi:MAG: Mrp family chromosome partitioning ATPase [Candidatus Poriferisodalaceae bacterium]|jgi:Mrp family chromosome partitioning ATPase